VRVAWLHLRRHWLDEAHILMRAGILRLNASHGLVETGTRGYHETLTRFWLTVVRSLMAEGEQRTDDFIARNAGALAKDEVYSFYSRDLVTSMHARAVFVAPDLRPLP
jgi:hypothetical protein